ncbi:MAG: electron transport complex subunit RsxC [Gammaproteobacteria bacterium]|nr:electron transport complex subunit RsxC [Gammaproteobacteria bacterium]
MAEMRSRDGVQLHRFPGGLLLDDHKAMATQRPVEKAPLPKELVIPLQQHIGEPAMPIVEVGEHVLGGQPIAEAQGHISALVHATSSGTVKEITERLIPHPSGLTAPCVVIETDGKDEFVSPEPLDGWQQAEPAAIHQHVRNAGIVGLGGAAFPTDIKLTADEFLQIDRLILNGAECEPYICCDDMLMRERAEEVISGALVMLRALATERCQLAIEDNKPEAEQALRDAIKQADAADHIELVIVPSVYPEGGEKQLIQVLTGKEVPSDGLPIDIGIVCHNVGTAAAVHRAVVNGTPLVSRFVAVTGGGVREPRVLDSRIGTPFATLIESAGGALDSAVRLLMGGPMMGFAIRDDSVPVIKATNCILLATDDEIRPAKEPMPCIRCGECAQVCPASLLPQQLYWHTRAREMDKVEDYDIFDCIECGCCDVVCPSHIPLASHFRFAKTEIWGKEAERARADIARQRYEARQERIEKEKREQEERRQRKKKMLDNLDREKSKKDEIKAAMERAKQKKREKQEGKD